jgi:hypothetical protein
MASLVMYLAEFELFDVNELECPDCGVKTKRDGTPPQGYFRGYNGGPNGTPTYISFCVCDHEFYIGVIE